MEDYDIAHVHGYVIRASEPALLMVSAKKLNQGLWTDPQAAQTRFLYMIYSAIYGM